MYPLKMQLPAPAVGFALANDEDEHITLSEQGYQPAYMPQAKPQKQAKA